METNSLMQLLRKYKVVIPPIQRDYAQGRSTGKIPHIREQFVDAIVQVLSDDQAPELELDFVYGYIEKDVSASVSFSVFKPLDGQQRLTTLFLMHWYIAQKEKKMDEAGVYLSRFTYLTRKSSRDFCKKLIEFIPVDDGSPLNKQIIDQSWFYSTWLSDPTISSMLVMLELIEQKCRHLDNLWDKLTGTIPRVIFHLLPMEDLGLPDDLYIKMNARGKGLTDFEHFKSQFSALLEPEHMRVFNSRIDNEWSDLFWNIFKSRQSDDIAREVDNGFLSFFWYITDIMIIRQDIDISGNFWIEKIKTVYAGNRDNVDYLFRCLDLFERLEGQNPAYFEEIFYIGVEDFSIDKTRIFFNSPKVNLFHKCAECYGFGDKKNSFSVGEQLMLFAYIHMEINIGVVDKSKFRLLRNIFYSSEDQLRNEYLGTFLYNDIELIIANESFSVNSKLSKRQLEEERRKKDFIIQSPGLKEVIYRIEDHTLLRGSISIFNIDQTIESFSAKFHEIFMPGCDYFAISKAMLTFGNYTQDYSRFRRFGNGNNSVWREIFTQSESRSLFDGTRQVLKDYLAYLINHASHSNDSIINNYLAKANQEPDSEKNILYYYIRYRSFTHWQDNQTDGFYWWEDYLNMPYQCTMLFKTNYRGRHWSPFLLELSSSVEGCTLDNFGNNLQFTLGSIQLLVSHQNDGFRFMSIENDQASKTYIDLLIAQEKLNDNGLLLINQNEAGIDIEDRIVKAKDFLDSLKTM